MKKSFFIFSVCVFCSHVMFAQIKVASNGNVGIQLGITTPLSALSIGGEGFTNSKVFFTGTNTVLKIQRTGASSAGMSLYGIDASTTLTSNGPTFNYGVKGQSYSAGSNIPYARTYGVLGVAGNGNTGFNYGVMGQLSGSANGSGIVGLISNSSYPEIEISGIYAGYFGGNVRSIGSMIAYNFVTTSDRRYKKNIESIDNEQIKGVFSLNPVKYNLEQCYYKTLSDTDKTLLPYFDEKSQLYQKKHYGLIAQELQQIYPDLVYEDAEGYLSVDYTGLIPLLIESIKELKNEVEVLKTSESSIHKASQSPTSLLLNEAETTTLYQNNPNPFSQTTLIKYYLPKTATTAYLCVYDLQGKQLKQYTLTKRGEGSKIISASEFPAGIYLYGLISDGKEVDVKRMVLME